MKPASKTPASRKMILAAATLLGSAAFVMGAPAAYADDFCISNGAQAAHGCGYPTMEACRASAAGIGGMCAAALSTGNPSNALAYAPKQAHARSGIRSSSTPKAPPPNDD